MPSEGRLVATGVSGKSMEYNATRGDYIVSMGFGSGNKNHGLYSWPKNDWMIYSTETGVVRVKGSADTLTTGRTLKVDLDSTSASTAFDGSANITDIGVSGTLAIANGGTGVYIHTSIKPTTSYFRVQGYMMGTGSSYSTGLIYFSVYATSTSLAGYYYDPFGSVPNGITAIIDGDGYLVLNVGITVSAVQQWEVRVLYSSAYVNRISAIDATAPTTSAVTKALTRKYPTIADSGVTATNYGPSANASPSHGGTFSVPYITVDAKGRITAASTKTITLPADNNTDTKVNVTLATTTKAYLLGTSTTPTSTATGVTALADTGVFLNTTAGGLTCAQLTVSTAGNVSGVAKTFTASLAVATWATDTYGGFTYTVTISGLSASAKHPVLDLVTQNPTSAANYTKAKQQEEGFSQIYKAQITAADTLKIWAHSKPAVALPIQISVVGT